MITEKHRELTNKILQDTNIARMKIQSLNSILEEAELKQYEAISYLIFDWEMHLRKIEKRVQKLEKSLH